jgi:predicted small secreted protein
MKYFLHDTNSFDDEKITELFMKFGYEGLGLFYTLLEKIAKQEKPVKTSVLKTQLKVKKRLEKCWCFMEQIGIISSRNGETFNEKLLNYSEMYQIKKEKTRKKVQEWREKQSDANNVTSYVSDCNQPKVKVYKVKESKVKEVTPNKSADFIDQIIDCFIQEHGSYEILNRGKERSAAGKILNHYHKKYPDANSEETLRALRTYFASCIKIEDNWLRENMSLPTIINKFNEINNILRNGKRKGSGATDKEFASFYANQYGTDAVK